MALSAIDQRFLDKVAAVGENLAESDFDVDQLNSAVALSRTQLQRKRRALTGQSPAEYIRTARLQTALALLRARAGTVAEIGYQVGFSSPAHFSTVFSREFGYLPSEVVRQQGPATVVSRDARRPFFCGPLIRFSKAFIEHF
jgi:transcriptional regulator GlxA family with amidase domain